MTSHYFDDRADRPRAAATITRRSRGREVVPAHRGRGVRGRGPGPRHRRAAARVAAADRHAAGAGPGLRVRADRAGGRPGLPGGDGRRGGRQRAGAGPVPGQRAGRSAWPTGSGCCDPRTSTRTPATTRSGPTRRSGSARRPCTTLLLTWLPRLTADRRRPAGGREEPRRRHPAALADRAGVRGRPDRVQQGLPGAGGSRSAGVPNPPSPRSPSAPRASGGRGSGHPG